MRKMALLAVGVALVIASSATAATLITSKMIKDFTIKSRDMATGSVDGRVLENGSVSTADLNGGRVALASEAQHALEADESQHAAEADHALTTETWVEHVTFADRALSADSAKALDSSANTGFSIKTATKEIPGTPGARVFQTAHCDGGEHVSGGGFQITGADQDVITGDTHVRMMYPSNINGEGSYYVELLVKEVSDWTAYPGTLRVWAICQQ